jgi:hypothetical protein
VQTKLLRSVFSVTELVLGLTLVALGSYSLWSMRDCPQTAHDCVGWSLLGGAMFLPPGILVTTAGALSCAWRRAPITLIQSLLIGALIAYYFLMGFE